MDLHKGIVKTNEYIQDKYYHLRIVCDGLAKTVKEGQIIFIRCSPLADPLLRRPFSIYRFDEKTGEISLMYILKGKGTEIMKDLKPGDELDLLGPAGRPYPVGEGTGPIGILARGVGIASVVSVAERARKEGRHVSAILSGRNPEAVLAVDFLEEIGCQVFSVNDAAETSGKEHVMDLLEKSVQKHQIKQLFTCGSNRMAAWVQEISRKYEVAAYVSLEERMACGIGICYGCTCETKEGYQRVCQDGPVFPIEEVVKL